MNRRTVCLLLILCTVLLAGQPLFAWDGAFFDLFQIPLTPRAAALGGIHAAMVDGVGTLFGNPAGYRSADPTMSLGQAMLSVYDSGPKLIDEALLGEPPGSSATRRGSLDLMGPLYLGYVGNGLGFGLFNNTKIRTWTSGPSTSGFSTIEEDFLFIAGYAFSIPLPEEWRSTLDFGVSVPIFAGALSNSSKVALGVLNGSLSPMDLIANEMFIFASGAGIEAGVLYSYAKTFSVGIVARNLAIDTQNRYGTFVSFLAGTPPVTLDVPLPLDLTVGVLWSPPVKQYVSFLDGFSLMVDYRNAIDFLTYADRATNPLLHISAGLELRLLKILYLRAGFYQMLPSFGVELDLTVFRLNVAMVGRELSQEPGGYPIYGYLLGLSL